MANEVSKVNQCSGCGGPVKVRRPSTTGMHWCSSLDCQSKKSTYYRKRKVETARERGDRRAAEALKRLDDALDMIITLASGARAHCPTCGLVDALPGFAHPDPAGGPCWGLGGHERAVSARVLPALWPEATRTYQKESR